MDRGFLFWLLVGVAQAGCHDYETRVRVRDPSQVSVLARRNDGNTEPILGAGHEPTSASFWQAPGGATVRAVRTPTTLELRCEACESGTFVLLDATNTSHEVDAEAADVMPPTGAPFRISYHYTVASAAGSTGTTNWYQEQFLQPTLETPSENVVEVRQKKTPDRMLGAGLLVPGVLFTSVGYLLVKHDVGVGTPILIGGVVFDAGAVYQLFFPAKESVVTSGSR